ncbi:kinase-like protein [Rhizopogon salebrosus TDB-379]|nr:kinase-like protein [Rhizopogon salebrosus TDB-379]
MAMATTSLTPLYTVQEASRQSTKAWKNDLTNLFRLAKDRFADVVWELHSDDNHDNHDELWGHKAIVYARASHSFQQRYFPFRPPPIASPTLYSTSPSPAPAQSAMSLSLTLDYAQISRSPYRSSSPSPFTITRIPAISSTALLYNELEYLYTGEGLGEAFESPFDTTESRELVGAEENRTDKLRKDLVFMWRSRLYSDMCIVLSGTFSSTNHKPTTVTFSSHRFILVSRSPYFYAQLLNRAQPAKPGEPITVTLPSPPFTPASLYFILGYIYTGTLVFSHRTYDLVTAFAILKSATYLSLDGLVAEIQARIVYEMLHGLFHASLELNEYERITGSKWGTGGCRCRQCARRAPRLLEFALADGVKNTYLERGARRALVSLFGEGWCISEFASLPPRTRKSLLKGLAKKTTPLNVFPLLFAAQHAMKKLDVVIDAWGDTSREMVLQAQKVIDDCLVSQSAECFEQEDWLQIMEADGVRLEDSERVAWVMEAIKRGMVEKHAGMMYQTLVNILLRPHLTDDDAAMHSTTSHICVQVKDVRADLIRYIRRHWMGARQQGGFDGLEGWAVKEISQELGVSVDDLVSPAQPSNPWRTAFRKSSATADAESDTSEIMQPLAQSVLNTIIPTCSETTATEEQTSQESTGSGSDSLQDLTHLLQGKSNYPITSGGFGDIWKCHLVRLNETVQVAVKTIRAFDSDNDVLMQKNSRRVRRELKVWGRLKHERILPLWGVADYFGPYPAMICPWVDNGALTGFLERQQDTLSFQDKFSLLNDIALGLQYLHSKSIVHGDLTGSNVLVHGDGRACLADFGLSTMLLEFIGPSYLTSSIRGNIRWAAAELFDIPEDDQDEAAVCLSIECDIYSFGSIALQVLTCKVPYYNVKKDNVVLGHVIRGKKPEPPKESPIVELHWEFIQRCWLPRASRPSVGEIVEFVACARQALVS